MNKISVKLNEKDFRLVQDYVNANNITISDLFLNTVLEKIEAEIDLGLYHKAIKEHQENPSDISV